MNITRVIAVHKHKEMVSLSLFMERVSLLIFMTMFICTVGVSYRCLPSANTGASAILHFEIRTTQSVAGEMKGNTVPENRLSFPIHQVWEDSVQNI